MMARRRKEEERVCGGRKARKKRGKSTCIKDGRGRRERNYG